MQLPRVKPPSLRRDTWANHQGSVYSLLGDKAPPVVAVGTEFKHQGWWTLRFLVAELCKWARENPGCVPTRDDVSKWVIRVNTSPKPRNIIFIAAMPPNPSRRVAFGIKGGLYHECFHGVYSCSRALEIDEVCDLVIPRWAKVANWAPHYQRLQEWQNISEDIRIERCGIQDYPGVVIKMHDLQDIILGMEGPSTQAASIVLRTFRDVGLGYNTLRQREALDNYREWNEDAVNLVLDGPLSGLLRENIALTAEDELDSLRIAMEVIALLADLVEDEEPPQQAGKPQCPSCGAPGDKLRLHPMSDGQGGHVPGKAIMTCTVCGFQVEVDLQEGGSGHSDPDDGVPCEDPGGGEPADDETEEPEDGEPGESSGDDAPGDDDDPSGDDGCDDDGDDPSPGDGGDEPPGEPEEGEGEDDLAGSGRSPDDQPEEEEEEEGLMLSPVPGGDGDEGDDDDEDEAPTGIGGEGPGEEGPVEPWDPSLLEAAADILGDDNPADLEDVSSALSQEVEAEIEAAEAACEEGERPWMPYNLSEDRVLMVDPSVQGQAADQSRALLLRERVRLASAFIRAQIRIRLTKLKQVKTRHGVRQGRGLSSRNLVHTKVALESRKTPSRAYWKRGRRITTSLAVAVVLDQSTSMGWDVQIEYKDEDTGQTLKKKVNKKVFASEAMTAITEPFDNLNIPVQVSGFRLNPMPFDEFRRRYSKPPPPPFHRSYGITHDIFKLFDERFSRALWRFANMRAEGGTPLADGVQFGMDCLQDRPEMGKILFVVTDGQPAPGHAAIMRSQFRIAKSLGIHVIGVGMGPDAEYVEGLFPDHVYAENLTGLAQKLTHKVNTLLQPEGFTTDPGSYTPPMRASS